MAKFFIFEISEDGFYLFPQVEPVYFYINVVFGLQAVYVVALFGTAWLLSESLLAGVLATAFYVFNRLVNTQVCSSDCTCDMYIFSSYVCAHYVCLCIQNVYVHNFTYSVHVCTHSSH